MEPQLDFWCQLVWEMVENTLDEDTDAGGVDGIWMRSRRGSLGDHELVTAPKYCGKLLVDENKWQRVKQPYQKQKCNNRGGNCKIITRRYCGCNEVLLLCAECYVTNVLDAET